MGVILSEDVGSQSYISAKKIYKLMWEGGDGEGDSSYNSIKYGAELRDCQFPT